MKRRTFISLMSVMAAAGALSLAGCSSSKSASSAAANKLETIQSNGKLVIALEGAWQPWSFHDESDTLVGYDVEVSRAIAEKLGVEPEYVESDWDSLFAGLDAGRYDLVCNGVEVTEERAKTYDFTTPYGYIHTALAVRKDNDDIKSFQDLKGHKVAVQIGTTSAEAVKKLGGVEVKELNTPADCFMELKGNGVDAVVNDRPVNDYYITKSGETGVKALEEKLTAEDYGIAMAKDNTELQSKINEALKKLKENGEYDKIYAKWFGGQK